MEHENTRMRQYEISVDKLARLIGVWLNFEPDEYEYNFKDNKLIFNLIKKS